MLKIITEVVAAKWQHREWIAANLPDGSAAAAVFSDDITDPKKTPCSQLRASATRGTVVARRPPKRMADIGTPAGSSHEGAIDGHWEAGTVNRALGWAAGLSDSGVRSGLSSQSNEPAPRR